MATFKYYLGLDMGTNSVGWAVTDANYNLLKAKGKDLWGIREFNEASTAVERRTHRISRRRRQREQVRIGLLKDYFHDAIYEVDPDFFHRLTNSKYHMEDKDAEVRYKNNIFNDDNYTDKDYFNQYPTIYHLRRELLENTDSLLLSTCARETALNGYITQIGLFHDNIFNQFNFASDLMEPFRPIVDNLVKNMMPEKFEHDEKIEILRLLQKEVIIAGRKEYVNNAMKIYCRSIFDALNDGDISLIKFYRDEL